MVRKTIIDFKRNMSFFIKTNLPGDKFKNHQYSNQKGIKYLKREFSQFALPSSFNKENLSAKFKKQSQNSLPISSTNKVYKTNSKGLNLPYTNHFVADLVTKLSLQISKRFALKGKSTYSFCEDCVTAVKPILETRKLRKGRMTYRVPKVTPLQRQEGKAISLLIEQASSLSQNDLRTEWQNSNNIKKSTPLQSTSSSSRKGMSSLKASKKNLIVEQTSKADEKTKASLLLSDQHTSSSFNASPANSQTKTRSDFLTLSSHLQPSAFTVFDCKKQHKKVQLIDKNAFLTTSVPKVIELMVEPSQEIALPIKKIGENNTLAPTQFEKKRGNEAQNENTENCFTQSSIFSKRENLSSKQQNKQGMKDCLSLTFFDSGHGKGESIEKRKQLHLFALQNRAYLHFRWW